MAKKKPASLTALADISEMTSKHNRLNDILKSWKENPGRAPNGTGTTGLMSTDKEGYGQMLNEQKEALDLQNELSGKAPTQVREAPLVERHFDSAEQVPYEDQSLYKGGPSYGEANFWNPYSTDQFRRGSLGGLKKLVG